MSQLYALTRDQTVVCTSYLNGSAPPDGYTAIPIDENDAEIVGWKWDGTNFIDPSILSKTELDSYAAKKRYEKETGGITVSGIYISTDRQSQGMINGAFSFSQVFPNQTIKWKVADGVFADLNAQTITGIAVAVATHIQTCFATESTVNSQIQSGTITTSTEIDAVFNNLLTVY